MNHVVTIGLDIAKSVFQLHGIDSAGAVVVRKRLTRSRMLPFFEQQAPCIIGIEACGSAHYWARELGRFGHEVRLIPPSYVKPYLKHQKNDAADAEAICEAVMRPSMRFVPMKSREQRSIMVAHRTRSILTRQRTQLSNAIRGHMSEFGLIAPIGRIGLELLIAILDDAGDVRVPTTARACLLMLVAQLRLVNEQILDSDRCIIACARSSEVGRLLMGIPGRRTGPGECARGYSRGSQGISVRQKSRRMDWPGAATTLERRQGTIGRHHQAWGSLPPAIARDRRPRCDPVCATQWRAQAMARKIAGAANTEGRRGGPGKQNSAYRVGDYDQR